MTLIKIHRGRGRVKAFSALTIAVLVLVMFLLKTLTIIDTSGITRQLEVPALVGIPFVLWLSYKFFQDYRTCYILSIEREGRHFYLLAENGEKVRVMEFRRTSDFIKRPIIAATGEDQTEHYFPSYMIDSEDIDILLRRTQPS